MKSGIYKIENIKNKRLYIGSAKDLNERKINHFSMLRNNKHTSIILQRAYNKSNDKNNFVFSILEHCKEEDLIDRENYFLDKLCKSKQYINKISKDFLKISYNILPLASKGFSGKHRPETIEKMKMNHPLRKDILIYKGENFVKLVISATDGSKETGCRKNLILDACNTRRYITRSGYIFCFTKDKDDLESKLNNLKIVAHNKGYKYLDKSKFTNRTPVIVRNKNTKRSKIFQSQMEACNFYNLQPCTVNRCLKSGKPYKKYLKFDYYKI